MRRRPFVLVVLFALGFLLWSYQNPQNVEETQNVEKTQNVESLQDMQVSQSPPIVPQNEQGLSLLADSQPRYLSQCLNQVLVTKKWAFGSILCSDDEYHLGVAKLAKSFQEYSEVEPEEVQMILLVIEGLVSQEKAALMAERGWEICWVNDIPPPVSLRKDPSRFVHLYTKMYIFGWVEFEKVVFMDGDFLIFSSLRELFYLPGEFAAGLDYWIGPASSGLNGGLLVLTPRENTFDELMALLKTGDFALGPAEQGLLRQYFLTRIWTVLPFTFNAEVGVVEDIGMVGWRKKEAQYERGFAAYHYTGLKPFMKSKSTQDRRAGQGLSKVWHTRSNDIPPNSTAILTLQCRTHDSELRIFRGALEKQWAATKIFQIFGFSNFEVPEEIVQIRFKQTLCAKSSYRGRNFAQLFGRYKRVLQQFQYIFFMRPSLLATTPIGSDILKPLTYAGAGLYGGTAENVFWAWAQYSGGQSGRSLESIIKGHPEFEGIAEPQWKGSAAKTPLPTFIETDADPLIL